MKVSINALDGMGSPLWTNTNGVTHNFSYSPFGSTSKCSGDDGLLPGFNGERLDPVGQSYNLGNGYRTYNPTLMRFNAPIAGVLLVTADSINMPIAKVIRSIGRIRAGI